VAGAEVKTAAVAPTEVNGADEYVRVRWAWTRPGDVPHGGSIEDMSEAELRGQTPHEPQDPLELDASPTGNGLARV